MKDQPILNAGGILLRAPSSRGVGRRPGGLLPGALVWALLLVGSLWAVAHFRPEARMRRASARLVRLVEKTGEESPVALGLAANRLGKALATDAALEMNEFGALATGRKEIVQLFAQIRSMLARIEIQRPVLVAVSPRRGEVRVRVEARYRLVPDAGAAAEGPGSADLIWRKGDEGWRIERAMLVTEPDARFPVEW
jgi:hypothetical protein